MSIGKYSRSKLETIIRNVSTDGAGDITSVTAGNGLTGGGTSGAVTLAVDVDGATDGTGITVGPTDLLLLADRDAGYAVKKITVDQLGEAATTPAGSDTQIQYNNAGSLGGVSSLTYNNSTGDLSIPDDKKLYFGSNSDAHIKYAETGNDHLIISGSAEGIVLSGSTIHIDGVLEGASPLRIAGGIEIISRAGENTEMIVGDNIKAYYGTDRDTYIRYRLGNGTPQNMYLELSGGVGGIVLSGSTYMHNYLGVGVFGDDITHAITLPDSASRNGKIKASAYTTYSSARYKENVTTIANPIQTLSKLRGVTFDWKKGHSPDMGFIAEEVGEVLPFVVEWEPDSRWAQSMDYSRIVPLLVEAVKVQQKQITALELEIASLQKI